MPYAHQTNKKKIPRHLNRRIALTDTQRAEIVELWHAGNTMRHLARMYSVDKGTIKNIIDPEHYAAELKKRRGVSHWAQYYDKGKHAKYMRDHRRYKQKLHLNKGLI